MRDEKANARSQVAIAQGLYFFVSGMWAVVDLRSFQWITGRKTDLWLVNTIGGLIAAVGAAIGLAGLRRRVTPEIELLALGSSGVLGAADVIFVARRRISPVYLMDAAAEAILIWGWLRARRRPGQ
jgi:hypothetical protein